jgi:hypothetical protein
VPSTDNESYLKNVLATPGSPGTKRITVCTAMDEKLIHLGNRYSSAWGRPGRSCRCRGRGWCTRRGWRCRCRSLLLSSDYHGDTRERKNVVVIRAVIVEGELTSDLSFDFGLV